VRLGTADGSTVKSYHRGWGSQGREKKRADAPKREVRFAAAVNRHRLLGGARPRMGWTGRAPAPNRSESERRLPVGSGIANNQHLALPC
jgi:hypothetical protein